MPLRRLATTAVSALAVLVVAAGPLLASSHREAPGILRLPEVDGTDFYLFRSYEAGRDDFVTLIANYNPLQDPFGGPNYFPLDEDAAYDLHVTNNGDAIEDLTFRFRFTNSLKGFALDVGDPGQTQSVEIPLVNAGAFGPGFGDEANLNVTRSFTVELIFGRLEQPSTSTMLINSATGVPLFGMPFDNIGAKSAPDYEAYADGFIADWTAAGCGGGRVFAGQRKESFAVNLGETFDLVNVTDPLGAPDAEASSTENKNITALALEVPISCLTQGEGDVVAGWTTARLPKHRTVTRYPTFEQPDFQRGPLAQVSRLANPLVNEVAIGLADKNLWNASHPSGDAQFLSYVTHPTLPELLEILFGAAGVEAPNNFPRNDLVAVFLTGLAGVNSDGSVGEMMRLNTAIPPVAAAVQINLGLAAGDAAGYPNGRRPGDDTVDISLRAVMGLLCHLGLGLCDPADAPSGLLPFTDGALQNALQFDEEFPYLRTPLPGSPNDTP